MSGTRGEDERVFPISGSANQWKKEHGLDPDDERHKTKYLNFKQVTRDECNATPGWPDITGDAKRELHDRIHRRLQPHVKKRYIPWLVHQYKRNKPTEQLFEGQSPTHADKGTFWDIVMDQDANGEYNWFGFFRSCGVETELARDYAKKFKEEHMDEDLLPLVKVETLRDMDFKTGDILRVMRFIKVKYKDSSG